MQASRVAQVSRQRCRAGRCWSDDDGAAAVELAIVLPLLLLILFGIIDFGRAYNQQLVTTEAAREGARAAALGQSATTQVGYVVNGAFTPTVTVTACSAASSAANNATVTVSSTYTPITPVGKIVVIFGGSITWNTIAATGVMQCVG
jgi:Flp pilus assembly protein TadG